MGTLLRLLKQFHDLMAGGARVDKNALGLRNFFDSWKIIAHELNSRP
jgi:hypothetical protein